MKGRSCVEKQKGLPASCLQPLEFAGRDERIRTSGLSVPNAALYQAEPHPVKKAIMNMILGKCKSHDSKS